MGERITIPAQIRAARALLGWSQEELASEAEVSVNSVRDIEGQKRPADTSAATSIRIALDNEGIIFVSGDQNGGPGVRLGANRPNIISPPTTMTFWEGMPFSVEFRGKRIDVFVLRNALEDLAGFRKRQPDKAYLEVFKKYKGRILDGVAQASKNQKNYDEQGCLHVRYKDIPEQ